MILNLRDSKLNISNAFDVDYNLCKYNREDIFNFLNAAINSGRLPPGTRLPQEYLAKIFGVSRMPVREAMRQLELEGFIVSTRFYGTIVSGHIYDVAAEAHALRIILEPHIIGGVINRVDLLAEEVFPEHFSLGGLEYEVSISAYRNFCISLYSLSDSPYLRAIAMDELEKSIILLGSYLSGEQNFSCLEYSVNELIKNIKRRDKKNAIEQWRAHLFAMCKENFP